MITQDEIILMFREAHYAEALSNFRAAERAIEKQRLYLARRRARMEKQESTSR